MINQPSDTIKFTDEQSKQLEAFQIKLSNLQTEIRIANQNINTAHNDAIVATKEREYQEQRLAEINSNIIPAQAKLDEITNAIADAQASLSEFNKKSVVRESAIATKELELKDREDQILKRERNIEAGYDDLKKKIQSHEQDAVVFQEKVSKFKKIADIL